MMHGGPQDGFLSLLAHPQTQTNMQTLVTHVQSGRTIYIGCCGGARMAGHHYHPVQELGLNFLHANITVEKHPHELADLPDADVDGVPFLRLTKKSALLVVDQEACGFISVKEGTQKFAWHSAALTDIALRCLPLAAAAPAPPPGAGPATIGDVLSVAASSSDPAPARVVERCPPRPHEAWPVQALAPPAAKVPRVLPPWPPTMPALAPPAAKALLVLPPWPPTMPPLPPRPSPLRAEDVARFAWRDRWTHQLTKKSFTWTWESNGEEHKYYMYNMHGDAPKDHIIVYLPGTTQEYPNNQASPKKECDVPCWWTGEETVFVPEIINTGKHPWKQDLPAWMPWWLRWLYLRAPRGTTFSLMGFSRGAAWGLQMLGIFADAKLFQFRKVMLLAPYFLPSMDEERRERMLRAISGTASDDTVTIVWARDDMDSWNRMSETSDLRNAVRALPVAMIDGVKTTHEGLLEHVYKRGAWRWLQDAA